MRSNKHLYLLAVLFLTVAATLDAAEIVRVTLLKTKPKAAEPKSAAQGRRLLIGDETKRHVFIRNEKGAIEWEHPTGASHDLHRLPNGNILFQTDYQHIVEMTPNRQVVWSYDASKMNGNEGRRVEVHSFQRLPNGWTMISESGPGRIIEVDKEGKIQREVKLKVNKPNAHRDTRLVRKLASGNYLVSHEGDGMIREYDPMGALVWEYSVPLFDKKPAGGHGPEAWGNQAFSAVRLRNGNTLIGTGNGHSLLEVTPDKRIVWSVTQDELPGIKLAWVTTLQVLSNGNIIFGNCHAGPDNPQIIEINRDKKVLWTFKDFNNAGNSLTNSQVLDLEGEVIR